MIRFIKSTFEVVGYSCLLLLISSIVFPCYTLSQDKEYVSFDRDTLITTAREIMKNARFCALVTLDQTGQPQVRTMDPFAPEENMVVWFGTNSNTRKVKEIHNDPRVSLYYTNPGGSGYVTITGIAHIVDYEREKLKWWKEDWNNYYGDKKNNYILIKVVPERLDILSYKHGIIGDPENWRTPSIKFKESD